MIKSICLTKYDLSFFFLKCNLILMDQNLLLFFYSMHAIEDSCRWLGCTNPSALDAKPELLDLSHSGSRLFDCSLI